MRSVLSLLLAVSLCASALAVEQVRTAEAAYHCIRIHSVLGGYNGNSSIQYVELRLDVANQTALTGHTIRFFDATGTLKATFTFPIMTWSGAVGGSVLIGTSEFNSHVSGGAADVTFSASNTVGANGGDPLHPVQVPGGTVVWDQIGPTCNMVGSIVDSAAYGAATATFGTAAVALPDPSTLQALRLSNLALQPSNNSTEYSLQNVSTSTFTVLPANLTTDFTTPRNNARVVLQINSAASVGGVAEQPDVSSVDAVGSSSGGSDDRAFEVAAGIAAAAVACGAGWYVYRRRAHDRA